MISSKFWTDTYVEKLTPMEKFLFLYLLSNPLNNILGVYEISKKRISYESWIDLETVSKGLERFIKDWKILIVKDWIFIKNFPKNQSLNPNVLKWMQRILDLVPLAILRETWKGLKGYTKALGYLTLLNLTLPYLTTPNSNELGDEDFKTSLPAKIKINYDDEIEQLFNFWNWLKKVDKFWHWTRKLTADIKKLLARVFKKHSLADIELWIANYRKEIAGRDGWGYAEHRFTLVEFFTQKNWFKKFYNKI